MSNTHAQNPNSEGEEEMDKFDRDKREQEIIDRFKKMSPEEAEKQIAVLPFYHLLENKFIKPNQGVYITRYFLTKWKPTLGDAADIVLALRLLSDKDGETFAKLDKIAKLSGMSESTVKRWLSENEEVVKRAFSGSSGRRVEQWRLLHKYFLRSKSSRYLVKKVGNISRAKRTTNLYKIAMDDPIHPDDKPNFFAESMKQILDEEAEIWQKKQANSNKGQIDPNRKKPILLDDKNVDNPPYKGQIDPLIDRSNRPNLSLSYRSNVINVKETTNKKKDKPQTDQPENLFSEAYQRLIKNSPEAQSKTKEEIERLAQHILNVCRDEKSLGFYRRVAALCPENMIYRLTAEVKGMKLEHKITKTAGATFTDLIKRECQAVGIDLELK